MNSLVKLPDINTVAPITDNLDGWTIQDGKPEKKTWILNTSNDGSMISGYWEATPGTYYAGMRVILSMSSCMYSRAK